MTLAFDLPSCPNSLITRLDARWKLAGVLLAVALLAPLTSPGPALSALAGALLVAWIARVPLGWYLRRLGTSLALFTLFLIWLPLVVEPGHDVWDLGWLQISVTGTIRLLALSAKLCALISLVLVLLATTPLPELFKAAQALYIPRIIVHVSLLTYRYVYLVAEEFARLRLALRVRGFRNQASVHSYRTVGQVAGTLLVRSEERAERVGRAMECRGFTGAMHTLNEFATTLRDVVGFMVCVGIAGSLLAWDRLGY
jgi:cobalt/nickel transport system permease protein